MGGQTEVSLETAYTESRTYVEPRKARSNQNARPCINPVVLIANIRGTSITYRSCSVRERKSHGYLLAGARQVVIWKVSCNSSAGNILTATFLRSILGVAHSPRAHKEDNSKGNAVITHTEDNSKGSVAMTHKGDNSKGIVAMTHKGDNSKDNVTIYSARQGSLNGVFPIQRMNKIMQSYHNGLFKCLFK